MLDSINSLNFSCLIWGLGERFAAVVIVKSAPDEKHLPNIRNVSPAYRKTGISSGLLTKANCFFYILFKKASLPQTDYGK